MLLLSVIAVLQVFTLPVLTLLHLSALNNHQAVIDWLQHKLYPPNVKCLRFVHQKGEVNWFYQKVFIFGLQMTLEEYPEETAFARGHVNLKATLQLYRQVRISIFFCMCLIRKP